MFFFLEFCPEEVKSEDIVCVCLGSDFLLVSRLSLCDAQKNRPLTRGAFSKHRQHKCTFSEPLSGLAARPLTVSLG